MALGQIIRERREQMKLTLDEVSNRIGFSKPYLSTIETSKVKNPPSDDLLNKLEEVLEFEPGLLLHIAHLERMPSDIRFARNMKPLRQRFRNGGRLSRMSSIRKSARTNSAGLFPRKS